MRAPTRADPLSRPSRRTLPAADRGRARAEGGDTLADAIHLGIAPSATDASAGMSPSEPIDPTKTAPPIQRKETPS